MINHLVLFLYKEVQVKWFALAISSIFVAGLAEGAIKYKCDGEWVDYWPCDSKPMSNNAPAESEVPSQAIPEATQSAAAVGLPSNATDDEKLKALEKDIEQAKIKLAAARLEADRYVGGLVKSINEATVATQEQTLSMMEQRYFAMKYGRPSTASSSPSEHSLK